MHIIAIICFIFAFVFYLLDIAYFAGGLAIAGFILEMVAWVLLVFSKDKIEKK